jgi:hypothetical protein
MSTTLKHEDGFLTEMQRCPNLRLARECGYVAVDFHDGYGLRSITGQSVDLEMHTTEYLDA